MDLARFQRILVALDNSSLSEACCTAAVSLATTFGAEVTGAHVYAARLHERRFRQMETVLPQEYLVDEELERQRAIHNKLIALGLRLISESYLDALERRCRDTRVPFVRKTFDGKNWKQLVEEITASDYDLVVLGVRGHGLNRTDRVGSVCRRVLRRIRTDALILKDPDAFQDEEGGSIVVALDGSQESFGALQTALALSKAYHRNVEVVAAYDPFFHYAVFESMVAVLSSKAARVFRFKEQERLHAEIIDTGLARLYQNQLDLAERFAAAHGVKLSGTLLAGRASDEILAYLERGRPWLLLLGRVGVHSAKDQDIGDVTEYLLCSAPCNVLIASRRFSPSLSTLGWTAVRWTRGAEAMLERVPQEYQGALHLSLQRLAAEEGYTVVSASLVSRAVDALRPNADGMGRMEQAALSVALEAMSEGLPVFDQTKRWPLDA